MRVSIFIKIRLHQYYELFAKKNYDIYDKCKDFFLPDGNQLELQIHGKGFYKLHLMDLFVLNGFLLT